MSLEMGFIRAFEDLDEQVSFLVQRIQNERGSKFPLLIQPSCLDTTHPSLLLVASRFDRAGIPRSALPNVRLFSLPVSRILRGYTEIIFSPETCAGEHFSRGPKPA